MTTYYRDDRILINEATVRIDGQTYLLDDFAYVWHRRGTADLRVVSRRTARWVLLLLAVALGLLCTLKTPAALRLGAGVPDTTIRVALVLAASAAALAIGWPLVELVLSGLDHVHLRGVRVLEIWASWQGHDVLLLRSSDALRFGQVYRALQRAIEQRTG